MYVNGNKHGYVTSTGFQRCTQIPINSSSKETTSQENVKQAQNQQIQQANVQLAKYENSDHSLQNSQQPIQPIHQSNEQLENCTMNSDTSLKFSQHFSSN